MNIPTLVQESIIERAENRIRAQHNALCIDPDALFPYRNNRLCALIDAVESMLKSNK